MAPGYVFVDKERIRRVSLEEQVVFAPVVQRAVPEIIVQEQMSIL